MGALDTEVVVIHLIAFEVIEAMGLAGPGLSSNSQFRNFARLRGKLLLVLGSAHLKLLNKIKSFIQTNFDTTNQTATAFHDSIVLFGNFRPDFRSIN